MRHATDQHIQPCNCRSVGECDHNVFAWKYALDACVDDFAAQLKKKLIRKAMEGKGGWDDPTWPRDDIILQLREHINKGDMLDVAAFAMFAWNQDAPSQERFALAQDLVGTSLKTYRYDSSAKKTTSAY